jgi:hypothetical protein
MSTIFLLSPAYCAGRRAAILLRPDSDLPIARRLRAETLTLGDAFSFLSGLYFRGKITYARRFAHSSDATLVITPTLGLQSPDTVITAGLLREFAGVDISSDDARYRGPLERDLCALASRMSAESRAVLLGSVATGKYVDILARWLGARLHFPPSFIGRGDMSRGGLLLRHAASGVELEYGVLESGARRRGARPPKLDPATRVTLPAAGRAGRRSPAVVAS